MNQVPKLEQTIISKPKSFLPLTSGLFMRYPNFKNFLQLYYPKAFGLHRNLHRRVWAREDLCKF
jgi:hypothetical protein